MMEFPGVEYCTVDIVQLPIYNHAVTEAKLPRANNIPQTLSQRVKHAMNVIVSHELSITKPIHILVLFLSTNNGQYQINIGCAVTRRRGGCNSPNDNNNNKNI